MAPISYRDAGKNLIHVKCSKCKLEQLSHHGSKCWKCPGGVLKFIGGDVIKQRLLEAHGGNSGDRQKSAGRSGGGGHPSRDGKRDSRDPRRK
jgi:ribosomal protein L37AE/L43A